MATVTKPIAPSPGWMRALPAGPDARVKITEEYLGWFVDLRGDLRGSTGSLPPRLSRDSRRLRMNGQARLECPPSPSA
jgi:hypothetical protein